MKMNLDTCFHKAVATSTVKSELVMSACTKEYMCRRVEVKVKGIELRNSLASRYPTRDPSPREP